MEHPIIKFDYKKISYKKIFENEKLKEYTDKGVGTKESINAFGELNFPKAGEERIYTIGAFVTSIDGKIAYLDNSFGPMVAKANLHDKSGAELDFWILNLLRASMDAVFIGAGTMQKEPECYAGIYDKVLLNERITRNLPSSPWGIVCSLDGTDIPFQHELFNLSPTMINTSPEAIYTIAENIGKEYFIIGPYNSISEIDDEKVIGDFQKYKDAKIPIILTGQGEKTNSVVLFRILKLLGINKALVESPSYCHSLMKEGLLDELFLGYSCVYIGGNAIGLGHGMEPFTSKSHPHSELLSIHSHYPGFLYLRHKLIYGL